MYFIDRTLRLCFKHFLRMSVLSNNTRQNITYYKLVTVFCGLVYYVIKVYHYIFLQLNQMFFLKYDFFHFSMVY